MKVKSGIHEVEMALPVFRFKSSLQNNQIFDFAELYLAFGF
jgi:hypothetical protein